MKGVSGNDHTYVVDMGWDKFLYQTRSLKDSYVKAGFPEEGKTVGGYSMEEVIEHAIANEFGVTKHKIPSRPFMKQAFDKHAEEIYALITLQMEELKLGTTTAKIMFKRIGAELVEIIKLEMADGGFVANAPSTIARKESSEPLFDTRQMYNTVQYKSVVHSVSMKKTEGKI